MGPRTEALGGKRSPGSSVSIRVVISVSTVSGSAATPPSARKHDELGAKSGLPPERSDTSPDTPRKGRPLRRPRARPPAPGSAATSRHLLPSPGSSNEALRQARDRHEPGPRGAAAHEMEEDAVRGVVDPVRSIEDDERGPPPARGAGTPRPSWKHARDGTPLDLLGLRRHAHFRVRRNRKTAAATWGMTASIQGFRTASGGGFRIGDSGERAEQRAETDVRTGHSARRAA